MKTIVSLLALALASSATPLEERQMKMNGVNLMFANDHSPTPSPFNVEVPIGVMTPLKSSTEVANVDCHSTLNRYMCEVFATGGILAGNCTNAKTHGELNAVHTANKLYVSCKDNY